MPPMWMVSCGTVALATAWIIFEPCLMMPRCSASRADHVAGGVLQIDDRHICLAAELDELRGLGGAVGVDRPVVADNADGMALNLGVAADRLRAVARS